MKTFYTFFKLLLFTVFLFAFVFASAMASLKSDKQDCWDDFNEATEGDGGIHSYKEAKKIRKTCIEEAKIDNGQEECDDGNCGLGVREEYDGYEFTADILGTALPVIGSIYMNERQMYYQNKMTNTWADAYQRPYELWSQSYQAGHDSCNARFNSALQYQQNMGTVPMTSDEMSQFCNGTNYGAYPGMNGMSGGMWGMNGGNSWLSAGYSSQFMQGMIGPQGGSGMWPSGMMMQNMFQQPNMYAGGCMMMMQTPCQGGMQGGGGMTWPNGGMTGGGCMPGGGNWYPGGGCSGGGGWPSGGGGWPGGGGCSGGGGWPGGGSGWPGSGGSGCGGGGMMYPQQPRVVGYRSEPYTTYKPYVQWKPQLSYRAQTAYRQRPVIQYGNQMYLGNNIYGNQGSNQGYNGAYNQNGYSCGGPCQGTMPHNTGMGSYFSGSGGWGSQTQGWNQNWNSMQSSQMGAVQQREWGNAQSTQYGNAALQRMNGYTGYDASGGNSFGYTYGSQPYAAGNLGNQFGVTF